MKSGKLTSPKLQERIQDLQQNDDHNLWGYI